MRNQALAFVACILSLSLSRAAVAEPNLVRARFVGCPSDGQMGYLGPPRTGASPRIPERFAKRLAFYKAQQGPGVLAPRGWHCVALDGSNGGGLIVTPEGHSGPELLNARRPVVRGVFVERWWSSSETSGRFDVAAVAARFFPVAKAFVESVRAEGGDPIDPVELGAGDRITAQTSTRVEFVTPAGLAGLAVGGRIRPWSEASRGAYMLGCEGLTSVTVRLGRKDAAVEDFIFRHEVKRADRPRDAACISKMGQ